MMMMMVVVVMVVVVVMMMIIITIERKDYAFWRQLHEKPSIIPGCRGIITILIMTKTLSSS